MRSALALSPAILEAAQHAHESVTAQSTRLESLDRVTAGEIEAIASAIIPTDETPGAREAGVIYFIDRALATFDRSKRALYKTGLAEVQAHRKRLFPASLSIAALSASECDTLLHAVEKTEFFQVVRTHVVTGFLANPSWGGNRGNAGWKLIGFEEAHSFQPPFGYYDNPENGQ